MQVFYRKALKGRLANAELNKNLSSFSYLFQKYNQIKM